MKIKELEQLLKRTPVILQSNPIALAYLKNVRVVGNLQSFLREIDMPTQMKNEDIIITDTRHLDTDMFPIVEITEELFKPELHELLFENYDRLSGHLFSQSRVGDVITSNTDVDTIVLFLVDGLSYIDCRNTTGVIPCFVNGATFTEIGFRNVIGVPSIAHRLFEKGFKSRLGFSYWERDNKLTDILFEGFVGDQMRRVSEYDSITNILRENKLEKTFVQIVTAGCDEIAHKHRDRPIVDAIVKRIFEEYIPKVEEIISDKNLRGIIYLIADHGIWWRNRTGDTEHIVTPDPRTNHKRYFDGHVITSDVLHVECFGKKYSLLKYPYLFNDFAINEWGTHGGISYYESFVPFYKKEVL
jgi:hypothetical protein